MKLVIAIVQDVDADNLINRLLEKSFKVTQISSTGGFLKSGNTTLLAGVKDENLNEILRLIENNCKSRDVTRTIQPINIPGQAMVSAPIQLKIGGATIFVLDVLEYKRY